MVWNIKCGGGIFSKIWRKRTNKNKIMRMQPEKRI
jgi:hypothetical protein